MKRARETEVLVVGGGPVGLFSALVLARRGVAVQVVDQDRRTALHSYALALHPASLALLDEFGLAESVLAGGLRVDRIAFYEGETERASLALGELGGKFPFMAVCPQSRLEGALEERLREEGVHVQWNHRLADLAAAGGAAVARVERLEQVSCGYPVMRFEWVVASVSEMKADYVVGADGYHSLVRRRLGVNYENLGGAQSFHVFELAGSAAPSNEARIVLHGETTNVLWPLPEGRSRWTFEATDGAAQAATAETFRQLARERAPWQKDAPPEVLWTASVRFERRLAGSFGREKVWLAGDAAHLTSPVGAQSMNAGLREAHSLGTRLAGVLRDQEPFERLVDYGREAHDEWRRLLGAQTALRPLPGAGEWVRQHAARILPCLPASSEDLSRLLGQLSLELG